MDRQMHKCILNTYFLSHDTPVLAYSSEVGIFILDTDACLLSIGAVLSQEQDGGECVISCGSETLNPTQQQYCTTKRELLAVVRFMKHLKHYLLEHHFNIRTDRSGSENYRNQKVLCPNGLIDLMFCPW